MPLRWNIDQDQKLVCLDVEGTVHRAEFDSYLADLEKAGALSFPKLIDCSNSHGLTPMAELLAIGVRAKAYPSHVPGPLAFVAPTGTDGVKRLLGILASVPRPFRIFETRAAAERWISSLTA